MKKETVTFNNQDVKEMAVAKEAGLPHWKHREQYHKNWDALSADCKRWEFLRRNINYREAYEAATSGALLPSKLPKRFQKLKIIKQRSRGETLTPEGVAARYNLSWLMPPSCTWDKRPERTEFLSSNHSRQTLLTVEVIYPTDKEAEQPTPPNWADGIVWLKFNLDADIGDQLKIASKLLDKLRVQAAWASSVAAMMNANFADDGLWQDEPDIPRNRSVNKRPKEGDKNLDDQSYVISLLRICDARICGASFQRIAFFLSEEGSHISEDGAGKRYKFAQQYWKRI